MATPPSGSAEQSTENHQDEEHPDHEDGAAARRLSPVLRGIVLDRFLRRLISGRCARLFDHGIIHPSLEGAGGFD